MVKVGIFTLMTGIAGPSGFGSASTAEKVTDGIDASNLTAIVTGGASGIGLETARVLALRNAHVVIAARNMEAANEAKQLILKDNQAACVDVLKLDLSSMKSVRANNAGVMFCPYQLSEDGIEMQFATNYLGHFLLTNLLLDKMKETARATGIEGRIVNLSSVAQLHTYEGGVELDKINDKDYYSDKKAYGQSKLANLLHANELARRLQHLWHIFLVSDRISSPVKQEEGANISVNSVHPGLIMTNLFRHSGVLMRVLKAFTCLLWKNVPQ
ncbi:hypothetical protein C3L33_12482, partial [Rhododendron williamsianum]